MATTNVNTLVTKELDKKYSELEKYLKNDIRSSYIARKHFKISFLVLTFHQLYPTYKIHYNPKNTWFHFSPTGKHDIFYVDYTTQRLYSLSTVYRSSVECGDGTLVKKNLDLSGVLSLVKDIEYVNFCYKAVPYENWEQWTERAFRYDPAFDSGSNDGFYYLVSKVNDLFLNLIYELEW